MAETVNASGSGELAKRGRGRPRKSDAARNLVVPQGSVVASPPVMSAISSPPLMSVVASLPLMSAVVSTPVISVVASAPLMSAVASPPLMSAVASMPVISAVVSETPPAFTLSHSAENSANRAQGRGGRGRPRGSGNWQKLASLGEFFAETVVGDFRAHMIVVYAGEDVTEKILSLIQNGPRGICVLSANGTVSSSTILQPGSSGGVITYQGEFEILSLNGSFTISESGGVRSRKGGFSVSLADSNGHVIGGGVAGPLVAARPIQAVVGSFIPNAYKNHRRKQQSEARIVSPIQSVTNAAARPNLRTSVEADSSNRVEQKPPPEINMAARDE